MTDDTEDALRRALAEVAASTPTDPPPLRGAVVPLVDRRQRRVLAAVAAVVAVVAGITGAVLLTDGDEEPEAVETADDTSTTTDSPRSTSTSGQPTTTGPSTSATTLNTAPSTTVAVPPDRGEVLAYGDGWEVRRTEGTDSCVIVVNAGHETVEQCDLDLRAPEPQVVASVIVTVAGERRLTVVAAGRATSAEQPGPIGEIPLVADPFLADVRFLVTDVEMDVTLLRQGDPIIAALYGDRMVTDLFEPYGSYRRSSGSLSMGETIEIGAYGTADRPCVVAFRLTPFAEVAADDCSVAPFAVLTPTSDPMLLDPFGLAPLSEATEWSCTLPSGTSCGTDFVAPVPALGVTVLSWHGPISVDDGGTRADHVTFTVGDRSFDVAVPPAA